MAAKVIVPKINSVILTKEAAEEVEFDVPKPDTYVLWLKLKRGISNGNSYMNIYFDKHPPITWTITFDNLNETSWFSYDQWSASISIAEFIFLR